MTENNKCTASPCFGKHPRLGNDKKAGNLNIGKPNSTWEWLISAMWVGIDVVVRVCWDTDTMQSRSAVRSIEMLNRKILYGAFRSCFHGIAVGILVETRWWSIRLANVWIH